jgi:hypothetical protein
MTQFSAQRSGEDVVVPLTVVEYELNLHRRHSSESMNACKSAVASVGSRLVATELAHHVGTDERSKYFLGDWQASRKFILDAATRDARDLYFVHMQELLPVEGAPELAVAGIAFLHPGIVDFEFVSKIVGGSAADIMLLYACELSDEIAAAVRARLVRFKCMFIVGDLDMILIEAYYAKLGGSLPCPTEKAGLFSLYHYTLAYGGYHELPFDTVSERLAQDEALHSNSLHLRATYRALLYPYQLHHVGQPSFTEHHEVIPAAPTAQVQSPEYVRSFKQAQLDVKKKDTSTSDQYAACSLRSNQEQKSEYAAHHATDSNFYSAPQSLNGPFTQEAFPPFLSSPAPVSPPGPAAPHIDSPGVGSTEVHLEAAGLVAWDMDSHATSFLADLRKRQALCQMSALEAVGCGMNVTGALLPISVGPLARGVCIFEGPPPFLNSLSSNAFMSAALSVAETALQMKPHLLSSDRQAACTRFTFAIGLNFVSGAVRRYANTSTVLTTSELKQLLLTDLWCFLFKTHGMQRATWISHAPVDLLDLFIAVLQRGGWYGVSSRGEFGLLAEELNLASGTSVSCVGPTYLWLLSAYETRFIDLCLADPPLMRAAELGDVSRVSMFLSYGADIHSQNAQGDTALQIATRLNCILLAEHLVARGIRVDTSNHSGMTPLALASERGFVCIVELLITCEADPSIESDDGKTPMFYAITNDHIDVCKVLLNQGVSAACLVQPRYGLSALHVATTKGNIQLVNLLLELGAPVNSADVLVRTPLHVAAHFGHTTLVALLLGRGADPSKRTLQGLTPADIAWRQGFDAVGALLSGLEKLM